MWLEYNLVIVDFRLQVIKCGSIIKRLNKLQIEIIYLFSIIHFKTACELRIADSIT